MGLIEYSFCSTCIQPDQIRWSKLQLVVDLKEAADCMDLALHR